MCNYKIYIDMLQREVHIADKKELRIVSLVPSQTELLYDLGLEKQIVGQTVFCVHPEDKFQNAVKIGGTKKIDIAKIKLLEPDIIIGNKEENEKSQIAELAKHFPVWLSDIETLDDNAKMVASLGEIFNIIGQAAWINQQIQMGFAILKGRITHFNSAVYLIWNNPIMAAGNHTFINHMLAYAGFKNCVEESRYPQLTMGELKEINPEVLLLSSEPFPFKQKHIDEFKKALPNARVILVNGEYFSWYGSRLINAPQYFYKLISNQEEYA